MAGNLEEHPLPDVLPIIPDGWRYESLGALVEERGVSYGIVQPGRETSNGVPIVRVNNIRNGRIDTTDMLRVEADVEAKFQRSRLRGGEVLLTLVGTLGEVAIAPETLRGFNVARAVGVIPVRKDPGSLWVSICLRSAFIQYCIRTWATTTVQATFNLRDLAKLPIPIPPTDTREAIAHILGSLDDMIELNRRMNATLEGIARAFFQSWFVDFDPVRAKLDGRTPYGLDQATADLFPDSFEDSSLGPIPKGWGVESIGNLTTRVTKGDTPRKEAVATCAPIEPMVRMLRVNALTDDGEILLDKAELIPQSIHFGKSKRSILEPNDILYTNAGTIGRVAFVQEHHLPANTNQAMAIVRPNADSVPPLYLYLAMRHEEFQSALHQDIVHAVQPNLALGKISNARLVLPHDKILTRLWPAIDSLVKQVFHNRITNQILANLRDTLLPKLLSGELSVDEAGRCVEQAV